MLYHEMKKHILQGLLESGWYAVDDVAMECTTAVAKKDFETAVGVKTAIAYFTGSRAECCRLGGDYYSEGNNILSTTSFYVWYRPRPEAAKVFPEHLYKLEEELEPADLVKGGKVFSEMADKKISGSYAVRIHHIGATNKLSLGSAQSIGE